MQGGNRMRRRFAWAAVLITIIGTGAACGDDDSAAGTSDACTSLVDFDALASEDTDTSTPDAARTLAGKLDALWQKTLTVVPSSARADADVVTAAIADMAKGDDEAFSADETYESFAKVVSATVKPCKFPTLDVRATESGGKYAFSGMPATRKPGVVAVTMTNKGVEPHVMVIYRKNDGEKRSAEEILALPEDEAEKAGTQAGAVFALPGASGVGMIRLTPGDYVYFCPIPIGGGDDGAPHFTEGMYGTLTVK